MSELAPASEVQDRYYRQGLLPELGSAGQERLKKAAVAIVGLGGLGSPVSMYLTAAGVGRLVLIDHDVVSLSNLNRQILYREADLGRPKAESASEHLKDANGGVVLEPKGRRLTEENSDSLLSGLDLVVDCLDSLHSRRVLMGAALRLGIPLVHGAVRGFEGRLTVVIPRKTACLACWLPETDSGEVVPVIGPTPGVIGSLQANEALKCLLGISSLLAGQLLLYDGLTMQFRQMAVEADPECPVCGPFSGRRKL